MKDTEFEKKIIERLDELSAKMDILVQVVAISPKIETILKDKTKTQQIEILSNLRLSNDAIALIVGTNPETVGVRISEMKKKKKKKGKKRRQIIGKNTKRDT
jgi:3-polyprenyl-4-hydroxybenzoate decarboxylase